MPPVTSGLGSLGVVGAFSTSHRRVVGRTRTAAVVVALTLVSTVLALAHDGTVTTSARARTDVPARSLLDPYLTVLSRDLTGRSPTPAVRSLWTRQLAEGMSRSELADGVSRKDFASDLQIRSAYARVLARAPTSDWSMIWQTRLRAGTPVSTLVLELFASDELYRHVGATPTAIVDHLYQAILGRAPDATRRADTIRLLAAGYPRIGLVEHLWRSTEGAGRRVDRLYRSLVGRPPTATWRARWTTMLTIFDDRLLAAALAASDEYVRRAPGRAGGLYLADQPLRVGTAGLAYVTSLHASGGTPPYRFSVTGLPAGLALQGSALTGTPQEPGSTFVSLTVRDAAGRTTSRQVALSVAERLPPRVALFEPAGPVDTAVLTYDGNDAYRFSRTDRTLTVAAAPGNQGSLLRTVIVPRNAPSIGSAESCARWTSASSGGVQQGAALQVGVGVDGRVRALTVTKNVAFGPYWAFNFHTFDTARSTAHQRFGQVALPQVFLDGRVVAHLPWGMCARVRRGYLEFKAWPAAQAEPAWGDPLHGGRIRIPAGWDTAGRPGWYVGHLHPGESMRYDAMTIWQRRPACTRPRAVIRGGGRPTRARPRRLRLTRAAARRYGPTATR